MVEEVMWAPSDSVLMECPSPISLAESVGGVTAPRRIRPLESTCPDFIQSYQIPNPTPRSSAPSGKGEDILYYNKVLAYLSLLLLFLVFGFWFFDLLLNRLSTIRI